MALIPGVSRAGITITAARFLNFNRYDATKISFLLSIPALLGASVINLNDVILRSISFLKISLKSKIFFDENKKQNLILGDEDQLYRVFINIIKNAEESIIEILNKKPKYEGKIDIDILNNNDYKVIVIKDNGEGISDTKKVMTPYFTTKKAGTGLGLPIVSKIINEHSGEFVIKKEKGTIIEVWLPSI